jgi:phosphoribosylglycinamide formyltransferase-1
MLNLESSLTRAPFPRPLGIIGSSGGSALAAAAECLASAGKKPSWCVITDRDCGLSTWAKTNAIAFKKINYSDAMKFSEDAYSFFWQLGLQDVLLFYTRRIDKPLIDRMNVYNIHPSLLPAFPGLGAVRRAQRARAGHIGATLHRVDAGLDTGEILLQATTTIDPDCSLEYCERISFVQKTWLTLRWHEMMAAGAVPPTEAPLSKPIREAFASFMKNLGCDHITEIGV